MIAHHGLLEALFVLYKDELAQNPKAAAQTLIRLHWEIKKHFFLEEEVIFKHYNSENKEIPSAIAMLIQQHDEILKELDQKEIDLEKISKLIISHRQIEDKFLYPLLDRELNEITKSMIISRINEIEFKQ